MSADELDSAEVTWAVAGALSKKSVNRLTSLLVFSHTESIDIWFLFLTHSVYLLFSRILSRL